VSDLDIKTWIESARLYGRLRRRAVRLSFAYIGIYVAFFAFFAAAAGDDVDPILPPLFFFLFLFVTFGWFLVASIASLKLWDFRCPRCGKRFVHYSWWSNWPTDRCKHCGLNLGSEAMEPVKPSSSAELWE
jgi:hypothetical protein